jgi:ubiquitin C-terminal hydrolase
MKELEEKKKNQKEKEQKELEEKIKKQKELEEQQKKKQKELEELQKKKQKELKEQQKKKQKEFEEQQKKKQKELEQLKLKQKAEEELLKQQKQNQDQNQQIIPPKQSITCKSINPPPLIGLQNIGSTCYMNATLQCFSHTEVLTDYFLNENNHTKIINNNISKKNPNLLQLSPSYLNLIKNLWLSHQKYFSPYAFRKNLAEMNPLFKELSANDAKDLLNYLLTQLHEELNLYVEKNIDEENDLNFNPYNEQMVLQNFVQSFFGKNKSVLSDHFFGIQESKFLCMGCEKKIWEIIFRLNSVFKHSIFCFFL